MNTADSVDSGHAGGTTPVTAMVGRTAVLPSSASSAWEVRLPDRTLGIRLQQWALLRTPGFPFRTAEVAAAPGLLAGADTVLDHEARLGTLAAEFAGLVRPLLEARADHAERRQRQRRAVRHVGRLVQERARLDKRAVDLLADTAQADWTLRWSTAVAEYDALRTAFIDRFEHARTAGGAAVLDAFVDERLKHAVHVSNPDFHDRCTASWARSPGMQPARSDRRLVNTLHRYLRRFGTRCETVSFFGPVLYVAVDPTLSAPVEIGPPGSERIVVEASAWLVEAISDHLVAEAAASDRSLRRSPLFAAANDGVLCHVVSGRLFRVQEAAFRLWEVADGRDLAELAAEIDASVPTAVNLARELGPTVEIGAAARPASVELHALSWLADRTSDPLVAALAVARDRYARTRWPARTAYLGEARRLASQLTDTRDDRPRGHYSDRDVFHEDRTSLHSGRVRLGRPAVDGVGHALAAVLPLCHLGALLRRADARAVLRGHLAGAGAPLAALTGADLPAGGPLTDVLHARLASLFGERHELASADLHTALADLWAAVPPNPREDACLPSPDLMAAGTDAGTAEWVLAELHDDCSSIYGGLESPLHDDPTGLWAAFATDVAELVGPRVATIVGRRRSAHVTPELPGVSIELAGRSAKPRGQVVPISEVQVPSSGDAVLIRGARHLLYPGDLSSPLHLALSLPAVVPVPVDLGAHTPRLSVDGVIYQRARWRTLIPESAQVTAIYRWRRELGLPRRVFIRYPSEPKPLYLDFADPLSVAEVVRSAGAEVTVIEMLPGPDDLWWSPDQPHCAELRLGCQLTTGQASPR